MQKPLHMLIALILMGEGRGESKRMHADFFLNCHCYITSHVFLITFDVQLRIFLQSDWPATIVAECTSLDVAHVPDYFRVA